MDCIPWRIIRPIAYDLDKPVQLCSSAQGQDFDRAVQASNASLDCNCPEECERLTFGLSTNVLDLDKEALCKDPSVMRRTNEVDSG